MAYLFAFISFIYSYVFYLFGKNLETIIFLVIGIVFFSYFFAISTEKKSKPKKEVKSKINFSISFLLKFINKFSYYFSFILFYISVYIILSYFNITFSYIIMIMNILIYLFFLISKKSTISYDFFKINSNLFSMFYIINYILIIISANNFFNYIDFINSILIIFSFIILIYHNLYSLKNKKYDTALFIYFFIYLYVIAIFYTHSYILKENISFWITSLSVIYSYLLFEKFPKINFLQKNKILLRSLGLIFLYIGIISGITFLLKTGFDFIIIFILIFSVYFNYNVHYKYQNYISLFLAFIVGIFIYYISLINFGIISNYSDFTLFLSGIILSFVLILMTYVFTFKYKKDYYIVNNFSYIINIFSIVIYFTTNKINPLIFGIILLFDSIYFFISYYKIKNLKKLK